MPVLFSKTCEYGVQACIYLAKQPKDKLCLQKDIARKIKVPPHFLGKILQSLSRHNIITSIKGKHGGFRLSRSPRRISILEVVRAIEGPAFMEGCFLGLPRLQREKILRST